VGITMIDFALEKFPVRKPLDNGVQCLIRPLVLEDQPAFQKFHLAVPETDRFLIKHRYTDSTVFHEWTHELDYEATLPLLAFADGQIVGHATLHQRPGGWKRHIGMVGVLTHPEYRGVNLVKLLIDELIEVAQHCGLTKLEAEFNGDRETAIYKFKECGFTELARIPDYLQDMHAQEYDWVLMGLKLTTDAENAGAGD
jgi:ribosomal protein S18 acetylase RimI-like enzyme